MNNDVDVLVIGSGFGGLTAASLAARSGLSVRLVERHTRPGGCAGDFGLEGFWFPAGATVVTGLEPGGILRRVFEELDIDVPHRPLDPSIVFAVGDQSLAYDSDHHAWKRRLAREFPATAAAYNRFWDWTHAAGGAIYRIGLVLPSLPLERWADVRRTLPAARPEALRTFPLLWRTVGDQMKRMGARGEPAIDAIVDSLLMDATGATAAECSAAQGAIALDLYRRGCQWVDGGTGRLAMLLVRSIRASGGVVDFGTEVSRLSRNASGWTAVLDGGDSVRATTVIANVPPAGLDGLLGRPVRLPSAGTAWGAFVLHLGITADGLDPMPPYHQLVDLQSDHGNSFVSIFPARKSDRAQWSVSVSCHVDPRDWGGNREDNAKRRQDMEGRLLDSVARIIPDVRSRIVVLRSATPSTFERYTARPRGYVGGLVQRPNIVALRAPGHRSERGLFVTGDHYFPGQGTVGTALSGINAYRDAAEHLGKRAIL